MVFQGLATVVILVTLNAFHISCQCPECPTKTHPQDAFCQADVVMRTFITEVLDEGEQTTYKLDIVKVFKEPAEPTIEATCVVLSLSGTEAAGCFFTLNALNASEPCGVELEVGTEYLISATVDDGKMFIDACSLAIPWDEVTSHMKIGVNRRYEKNCQCETGKDHCIIDPPPNDMCFCQYATCVEVKKKGCAPACKWKKSKTFKECVDGTLTVTI